MNSAVLLPPALDSFPEARTSRSAASAPVGFELSFACHACGRGQLAPEREAGRWARCAACDARLRVPSEDRPALQPLARRLVRAARLAGSLVLAAAVWTALAVLFAWGVRPETPSFARELACTLAAPLPLLLLFADRLRRPGPAWARFLPLAPLPLALAALAAC